MDLHALSHWKTQPRKGSFWIDPGLSGEFAISLRQGSHMSTELSGIARVTAVAAVAETLERTHARLKRLFLLRRKVRGSIPHFGEYFSTHYSHRLSEFIY